MRVIYRLQIYHLDALLFIDTLYIIVCVLNGIFIIIYLHYESCVYGHLTSLYKCNENRFTFYIASIHKYIHINSVTLYTVLLNTMTHSLCNLFVNTFELFILACFGFIVSQSTQKQSIILEDESKQALGQNNMVLVLKSRP